MCNCKQTTTTTQPKKPKQAPNFDSGHGVKIRG